MDEKENELEIDHMDNEIISEKKVNVVIERDRPTYKIFI